MCSDTSKCGRGSAVDIVRQSRCIEGFCAFQNDGNVGAGVLSRSVRFGMGMGMGMPAMQSYAPPMTAPMSYAPQMPTTYAVTRIEL